MQFRRVGSEKDRERVRSFFAENLADQTGYPIPPRSLDAEIGIPSILRVAEDEDGTIQAAMFASRNPEDVLRWRYRGQMRVASVIADEMLMIHEVAVAPAHRRRGLGAKLIAAGIDDARGSDASVVTVIFDDSQPGLYEFYTRSGFHALDRGELLNMRFAQLEGVSIGFPQDNPTYRWGVLPLNSRRVKILPPGPVR
ncbi:GNAT family N-acetyltransferase [Microbacterium oleivorans]|uniref:GNAT family N-acetyltransferase n=1 Tax=Microbacterium TaxID=33882 RepID=UPI00288132BB|nr:GNAT family N-acetyltransferase [Microbacterium sp. ARD31]MDT0182450.1 GNAT family N-acetyltransferase [Microbacterium sp. ARD31]